MADHILVCRRNIGFFITGMWAGKRFGRKKYFFIPVPFILFLLNTCILFKSPVVTDFGIEIYLIGLGILKLLTGGGLGLWALVDWIIGLVKAYGDSFGRVDEVKFINGKYAR